MRVTFGFDVNVDNDGLRLAFPGSHNPGDTGRVRDRLTTSPEIFGNASVAVAMYVLPATAPLSRTTRSVTKAANIVRFRLIFPAPIAKLEHRKSGLSIGRRRAGADNVDHRT